MQGLIRPLIFLAINTALPYCLGRGVCFSLRLSGRMRKAPAAWLIGLIFSTALFPLVCIPLALRGASLDTLVRIYGLLLAALFAVSLFISHKDIIKDFTGLKPALTYLHTDFRGSLPVLAGTALAFTGAVLSMILGRIEETDSEYVGMAVTAVQTNTLMKFDPYTGSLWDPVSVRRLIAPFPLLEAACSRLTGFHPAVICHFLIPGVVVAAAAVSVFLFFDAVFSLAYEQGSPERQKRPWTALCLVLLMYIYGNYSARSFGSMTLLVPWQGKAVLCSVVLPLFFAVVIPQLKKNMDLPAFAFIFITALSGAACNAAADLFIPLALGAVCAIKYKRQGPAQAALLASGALLPLCLDIAYLAYRLVTHSGPALIMPPAIVGEMIKSIVYFCGRGWYWLLWGLCTAWLFRREESGEYRDFLMVLYIIAIAIINPITGGMLMYILDCSYQVYAGLFWLLMIEPVAAFCIVEAMNAVPEGSPKSRAARRKAQASDEDAPKGFDRRALAVLLVLAAVVSGKFMFDRSTVVFLDNRMELSGAAIAAADYIVGHRSSPEDKAVVGKGLISQVRQYDSSVMLYYGRFKKKDAEYYLEVGKDELTECLSRYRRDGVRFIIVEYDKRSTDRLRKRGWIHVDDIENYSVYCPKGYNNEK